MITNSSFEIKDTEYLIKFNKHQFDLEFVKSILAFINQKLSVKEALPVGNIKDSDCEYNFDKDEYFSHLDEK